MRIFLALLLILVFEPDVICQSDTNYIPIAAYWEKGDAFDFKVTKVKRTWVDKKLTQDDSTQYTARFQILDADSASYTVQWSFRNNLFDKLQLPAESQNKFPDYRNTVVIYKTDEFGSFVEITNWQEISKMINDLVNEVIRVKVTDNNNKDEIKKSLEPLLHIYNSQRGIEQLVFKELLMLHFPYGKQYKRGEIYNYTEKIPVMINSEPATGDGVIFLRYANTGIQRCELVQRMKILPDSAKKMLRSHFHSIGMRPQAIGSTIESSVVEVSDENSYDYYYNPGIPVKVSVSRNTRLNVLEDKIRQIDLTIIERI